MEWAIWRRRWSSGRLSVSPLNVGGHLSHGGIDSTADDGLGAPGSVDRVMSRAERERRGGARRIERPGRVEHERGGAPSIIGNWPDTDLSVPLSRLGLLKRDSGEGERLRTRIGRVEGEGASWRRCEQLQGRAAPEKAEGGVTCDSLQRVPELFGRLLETMGGERGVAEVNQPLLVMIVGQLVGHGSK